MKKNLKNIIEENKTQFETGKAPSFIWENIQKELHPKKKKRLILYWSSGIAACLLAFFTFQMNKNTGIENLTLENYEAQEQSLAPNLDTNQKLRYSLNPETKENDEVLEEATFPLEQYELKMEPNTAEGSVVEANGQEIHTFTNKSNVVSYNWSFGDGNASQKPNLGNVYYSSPDKDGVQDFYDLDNKTLQGLSSDMATIEEPPEGLVIAQHHRYQCVAKDTVQFINNGEFYHPDELISTPVYDPIIENEYKFVQGEPLSTFSIDVDVASYADVRGSINRKVKPDPNAVKIEELLNYFTYNLPNPVGEVPFSVTTQIGVCPWNKKHQLLQVAMKGRKIDTQNLPANNLVFLLDVSGSMASVEKLGLIKKGFRLLVNEMRAKDKISIVVYADGEGIVLPPTSGANKEKIMQALERLEAGGGTAGSYGIELAYKIAEENFIKDGNNRIILATDGDFNLGTVDDYALVRLIEQKRKSGVFLTVLGVGYDNFQSSKMEKLADNGNGNFAFLDNILEAKKVLVTEMGATLLTIAKDVKLQLEFNPQHIAKYRLIGYENRLLENKDFNDDTKDAGELGSGHTIVALYELVPVGAVEKESSSPLRYNKTMKSDTSTKFNNEILMVNLRYKKPKESKSKLVSIPVYKNQLNKVNPDFYFAASVAQFGMLLRGSAHCTGSYDDVIGLANKGISFDPGGYRASFLQMVETVKLMNW